MLRRAVMLVSASALVLGAATLLGSTTEARGPKPPRCTTCAPTIQVGGVTCTLEACGFDCVYTCPFPG